MGLIRDSGTGIILEAAANGLFRRLFKSKLWLITSAAEELFLMFSINDVDMDWNEDGVRSNAEPLVFPW